MITNVKVTHEYRSSIGGELGPLFDALANPNVRRATKYISDKITVKATKQHRRMTGRQSTILVTFGGPNYDEREFIKICKKAGEPFPIKRVQIDEWPVKR